MPSSIDIAAVPNQTFTTTLDNNRYEINIYQTGNHMCVDITCNEIPLVTGDRIVNGQMWLPFAYLAGVNGNFILLTQNENLPDYTQFGITQTLVYQSASEIAAAVNGTVP